MLIKNSDDNSEDLAKSFPFVKVPIIRSQPLFMGKMDLNVDSP